MYRVRIVAGGHKLISGKSYDETFAAAVKAPSIQVILGNAVVQDWEIHHIDIKSAYLNAPLKERVYETTARSVEPGGVRQGLLSP